MSENLQGQPEDMQQMDSLPVYTAQTDAAESRFTLPYVVRAGLTGLALTGAVIGGGFAIEGGSNEPVKANSSPDCEIDDCNASSTTTTEFKEKGQSTTTTRPIVTTSTTEQVTTTTRPDVTTTTRPIVTTSTTEQVTTTTRPDVTTTTRPSTPPPTGGVPPTTEATPNTTGPTGTVAPETR